jgi:hypothetical protein
MSYKPLVGLFLIAASLLFSGCSANMQIVRAPLISPVVVPAPNQFKMNASVKNGTSQPQNGWVLFVHTEYGPPAPPQQPPTTKDSRFIVPALAANQSWGISDYDVSNGGAPCVQGQCTGHSWLVLCSYGAPAWNQCSTATTPDTCVHVWWQPDGSLSKMVVKDC